MRMFCSDNSWHRVSAVHECEAESCCVSFILGCDKGICLFVCLTLCVRACVWIILTCGPQAAPWSAPHWQNRHKHSQQQWPGGTTLTVYVCVSLSQRERERGGEPERERQIERGREGEWNQDKLKWAGRDKEWTNRNKTQHNTLFLCCAAALLMHWNFLPECVCQFSWSFKEKMALEKWVNKRIKMILGKRRKSILIIYWNLHHFIFNNLTI